MEGRWARPAQRGFVVEQTVGAGGPLETVHGTPGKLVTAHVRSYRGYRAGKGGWARLRLVPSTHVKLDISLGQPPQLAGGVAPAVAVYGMSTRPASMTRGEGIGIQVELPPHGAYAVLGVPLWELTDTVVDVAELLGCRAEQLVSRLLETREWRARLMLLDDLLVARAVPTPQVVWAWQRLCRSGGRIPISRLADDVGWTRRHLLTRFREQIGLSPKTAARVIRFQRALQLLLQPGSRMSLASIAYAANYSDQAHLSRECHTFTGAMPVELTAWQHREDGPSRC